MRAREDDGTDVRVSVCAINQLLQLLGNRNVKQRMRSPVDSRDEDRAAFFHIDVTVSPGRGLTGI